MRRKGSPSGNPEFTIGRLKFLLMEDAPSLVSRYVPYMKETYEALRSKGLGSLWYGLCFLMSDYESLDELSIRAYEAAGYDRKFISHRAGTYRSGMDVIALTQPITDYLVTSLVHEMGHRYWYQFMSSEQRVRFSYLIKIDYTKQLKRPQSVKKVGDAVKEKIDQRIGDMVAEVMLLKATRIRWPDKVLEAFDDKFFKLGHAVLSEDREYLKPVEFVQSYESPELQAAYADVIATAEKAYKYLGAFSVPLKEALSKFLDKDPKREDYLAEFKRLKTAWLNGAVSVLQAYRNASYKYVDTAVRVTEAKAAEEYAMFPMGGKVEPVSEYGRSNVVEAFAEVFERYVLGTDMNRDQLESFKSVLKRTASPTKVASRFLRLP